MFVSTEVVFIFVCSRVIVLDHHETAFERLCGDDASSLGENVVKVIDMERSGATIAFDYFKEKLVNPDDVGGGGVVNNHHPSVLEEFERVRKLFQYIEDGDLWRWRLQKSKAFSSGLKDLNIEFDAQINPSLFDQVVLSWHFNFLPVLFSEFVLSKWYLGARWGYPKVILPSSKVI